MNKDIHLYIGYMNDEQKNDFNLKNNENVHLLNLSNHIEGKDINDINCHYSELCVAYYVWKHQLKTDYISIGQHRRYITPINFERLDNNEVQVYPQYSKISDLSPYEFMIKDGINSYILISFIKYLLKNKLATKEKIYNIVFNSKFEVSYFNVFACNWNVFNNICNFIFGFLQDILLEGSYDSLHDINTFNDDIRLFYKYNRFIINENQLFADYNWGRLVTVDRNIAAVFELLVPLYAKICFNVFQEDNNKKIGIEILNFDENTIYNEIYKWISKNTFSGTYNFYIKTQKNNIEKLQTILNENIYGLTSGNVYIEEEFPENVIELKLNEYIDIDNPLDKLDVNNIKQF